MNKFSLCVIVLRQSALCTVISDKQGIKRKGVLCLTVKGFRSCPLASLVLTCVETACHGVEHVARQSCSPHGDQEVQREDEQGSTSDL